MKKLICTILIGIITTISFGQTLDTLKLTDTEIPMGYKISNELLCVTPHVKSFYNQTDLFESSLGKIIKKQFQSFSKKGDTGSILYFEFENEFKANSF